MKPIESYHLVKPEDLHWRPSNLMRISNADFLERTGSENPSARLWRYPPGSAGTPVDPKQLPKELAGVQWPPKE